MRRVRIIARLDVKAPNLVKGIQLEGLRKIGDPNEFARRYYEQGIDELFYADIVASLYERNSLSDIISRTTEDIFVPITVGGGLRSVDDVAAALRAGADKVCINTAAIKNPKLITEVANRFGSQCMVLSIQAKRIDGHWEAYFDNGREHSGKDAVAWAMEGESLGAGELLVTSVDREGTTKGYDVELLKAITSTVKIPVIGSGGMGSLEHAQEVVEDGGVDAFTMAHVLHYGKYQVDDVREFCEAQNIPVRKIQHGEAEE